MVDFVPIIVIGFAFALGLTPVTRQIAQRIGLVDKPSPRKVHRSPIPLMGGLAIYGSFLLALILFQGSLKPYIVELGAIIGSATWLAIIGFVDDRHDLSSWIKFPTQFLAAGTMLLAGVRIDLFHNGFDWLLTFVWIVGIINAANFLDNMDGLAAGIGAIAALFFFILSRSQGQELVSSLSGALAGAALGFLIYNFNPASTFMGDMGSLVLGFILAVLGIKLKFPHQPQAITWMIPILVLGLPIFDTSLVVFTRLREGRSPFKGGKDHTSHRLVTLGFSPRLAVVSLYGVCILLGIAAYAVSQAANVETANLIGGVAAVLGVVSFIGLEVVYVQHKRHKSTQDWAQHSA